MRGYSGVVRFAVSAAASALLGRRFLNCLWEVTYRCTARCSICNYWRNARTPDEELQCAKIQQGLDKIYRYGCRLINFTGGEPTLRTDLENIVAYASNLGMWTSVVTNGSLLTTERILSLRKAGLDNLLVSLDSLDPEIHDCQRGIHGSHARVLECIEGIQRLFLQGHRTGGIMCVLSSFNLQSASQVVNFADAHGVYVLFQPYHEKKTGRTQFNALITPQIIDELVLLKEKRRNMLNSKSYLLGLALPASGNGRSRCHAGRKYFSIDPYGYIHPCVDTPPVGHILATDVNTVRSEEAMELVNSCPGCWYCFRGEADTSLSLSGCWEKFNLALAVIARNAVHNMQSSHGIR